MLGYNDFGNGKSRGLHDLFGGELEDDAHVCLHSVWLANPIPLGRLTMLSVLPALLQIHSSERRVSIDRVGPYHDPVLETDHIG